MILEERPESQGEGEDGARLQAAGSGLKTQHSWLQSRRTRIHQQISKELRMRTGAENLYRATSNNQVRETVALELSYVNSNLQLLKEELEGLSSMVDMEKPKGEGVTVPMIPLGLKETKELDWATPLKELISGHFGEDGAAYEAEILELEGLRQAMRTPSRDEAGLQLLEAYYNQLCFLDMRFFSPARSPGLLFQWYDSLTGVPAQQRALAFEKGSVLFNIGALHTQIGACQDRSHPEGAYRAAQAFQRAAGAFSLLRENFSHAPSLDMSTASLSTLEQLMAAQAQECIFEGLSLPAPATPHNCLAQEAAQVAAEYRLVHRAMAQPPVQDYVPPSWTTLVHVKAEHFRALAHYHAAVALCDSSPAAEGELPMHEQVFQPPRSPEYQGPPLPQQPEERRKLAKAHLKRAILGQEEALRLHAMCRVLRTVDLLQAVVAQALRHSLAKYSELEREDDFFEATEAPDIQPCGGPEGQELQLDCALLLHLVPALPWLTDKDNPTGKDGEAHRGGGALGQQGRRPEVPGRASGHGVTPPLGQNSRVWGPLSPGFTSVPPFPPTLSAKTHRKLEVRPSSLSQMKVADIFHRLGPLSVFSTKNQWRLAGPVHMIRGEGGFGFTLRGDSPVLIAAVVPGGQAAAAGLKEGDYIVSVNGQPCKWWKHAEVVAQLRAVGEAGVSLHVVSLLPNPEPRGTGDRRPALLGPGGLLKSQRECGFEIPTPVHASPLPLLGWSPKTKWCKTGGHPQPSTGGDSGSCP
ncbi:rhophilin-1 isoform X2 [Fukomys damarensis]|uniref:rhophilin-1 isoform X2 n=1 Tax=Fukomys damarensis TaxID=885580 RepID=UPI00053FAA6F|nr:rhophilin-1 isoform X2 [Fukomys damarensis]